MRGSEYSVAMAASAAQETVQDLSPWPYRMTRSGIEAAAAALKVSIVGSVRWEDEALAAESLGCWSRSFEIPPTRVVSITGSIIWKTAGFYYSLRGFRESSISASDQPYSRCSLI